MIAATVNRINYTYQYNGLGRRVSKTGDGSTTVFAYAADAGYELIGEYDSSGNAMKEYIWLDGVPVAVLSGSRTYYVYPDHLGTPREITDDAGKTVWQWTGEAFGASAPNEDPGQTGTPFKFNLRFMGQFADSETGLSQNGFRDYNPQGGGFIESDPLGLGGGQLSTFAYAGSNPISNNDPSGLLFGGAVNAGECTGEDSAQYWADQYAKDSGLAAVGDYAGGLLASLWTPNTSDDTFAVLSAAIGSAAGARAAGTAGRGVEFSHSLPARYFRPMSISGKNVNPEYSPILDALLGSAKDTILNGNYRTPMEHFLEDNLRYPAGWQRFGPRYPGWLQKLSRIPNVVKGAGTGAAVGGSAAAAHGANGGGSCGCSK